jgi:superfamily I DNA/RNA helicase
MKFTHNCRNTEQIIYDTQLNTGADIGEAKIKGTGSYPIYQKVSSIEETATELEKKLELWSGEINKLNDIVILSSVDYALSSASHLSQKWQDKIQILTKENILNQNANKITYSTITNYKGLDKPIVAVIDIEKTMEVILEYKPEEKDLITKNIESFLYVAMTRSNSILWIAVSPKFGNFLKEQKKVNYAKMSRH